MDEADAVVDTVRLGFPFAREFSGMVLEQMLAAGECW
jgi:hypothetical protein